MRNRQVPIVRGLKERFDAKVEVLPLKDTPARVRHLGPCWQWTGAVDHGYGVMRIRRRIYKAHRVSVALRAGPFDPELVVDHLCGVRLCVAPHHLEPVTSVENARRYLFRSDDPGGRVLTTDQARALIDDLRHDRGTIEDLAERYGVTPKHVRKIQLGRYWSFVAATEEDPGR